MMGANWCHDSRALASRIYEEPLSTIINEHYETLFVDVGYLENGRHIAFTRLTRYWPRFS
jgi:hypothetical protein